MLKRSGIKNCKRAINLLCLNKSNRLKLTKYAKLPISYQENYLTWGREWEEI